MSLDIRIMKLSQDGRLFRIEDGTFIEDGILSEDAYSVLNDLYREAFKEEGTNLKDYSTIDKDAFEGGRVLVAMEGERVVGFTLYHVPGDKYYEESMNGVKRDLSLRERVLSGEDRTQIMKEFKKQEYLHDVTKLNAPPVEIPDFTENSGYIYFTAVLESHRGRKIASSLRETIFQLHPALDLYSHTRSDSKMRGLYKKQGFVEFLEMNGKFRDGVSSITAVKPK